MTTLPKYSFIPKNCLKLLFSTHLISDTSYLSQQNIFSGHRQSLSGVLSVLLFSNFYSNIFNSVEIYKMIMYDRWVVFTNKYLQTDW